MTIWFLYPNIQTNLLVISLVSLLLESFSYRKHGDNIMREAIIFLLNGGVATVVHFGVLTFNMQVIEMSSAGVANLIAAIFGVSTSYLGCRYIVFYKYQAPILSQAMKFGVLYTMIACLNGAVLYGWTDVYKFDYRIGFIIATTFQVILSYFGNKLLVFKS
jgi:putative flippase GtrA